MQKYFKYYHRGILIDLRAASVISDYTQYIYSGKGIIKPKCLLQQRFLKISSIFFPESSFREKNVSYYAHWFSLYLAF